MARCFFDIKNGHRLIDPTGLDCVDDLAAMRSARMIARQIANDANPDLPRRISVLDEDRSEIGTGRSRRRNQTWSSPKPSAIGGRDAN
jgi:hypothetical protein